LSTQSNPDNLIQLLHSVFGFTGFRVNQEAVCRAAIDGRDLLLVMPTGAGKSLCYQLPAIALGGTALVISPLIALMEDQYAKLAALNLRVGRIHSGLDRAVSRQVCVEYLRGDLHFLFIAPERLRVPGFPEMLAKRPPALIAIDEAHCISQWGHDFRPDYRMIGQHLPVLRKELSVPVLALTATATPAVQADIVTQLGMTNPARFIHGFRRDNLAIEVVEVPIPERPFAICKLLTKRAHRPAIVYATSRKQSEALAEELSQMMPAAAYHAGLDGETRERVQRAFLSGQLEVVVATIAFGMGIDKPDIRTVIHAGLPGTLEGYYQEIGRAGRDGAPSRTFLMHSYADQRTHGFFLNRDYPPIENLHGVFRLLGETPRMIEDLRAASKLAEEEFDKALEKLEIHGGARVDYLGNVTVGTPGWKKTYSIQAQYRAEQFEKVLRFTDSSDCRMCALVRHFGDEDDAAQPCGRCDICDPAGAVLRMFRRATNPERAIAERILDELRPVDHKGAGSLQKSVDPSGRISRDDFDAVLDALARARIVAIEDAVYEKDGEVRRYRKVSLSENERSTRSTPEAELLISDGIADEFATLTGHKGTRKAPRPSRESAKGPSQPAEVSLSAEGEVLASRLKEWRTTEAKRLRVPPYCVLHDRTLISVAFTCPSNPRELLEIEGIGPGKVEKFGPAILKICGAK
jgi:RecQ family ATP-dependent DNA helicase